MGRFVISGAALGLLVGLWEARLLYFVPSVKEFLVVDATYVIWFLAPLIAMAVFGTIGAVLGWIAGAGNQTSARRGVILAAVLIGCTGAYIGWAGHFVHTHAVNLTVYDRLKDLLFPLVRFAAVFAVALVAAYLGRHRIYRYFDPERRWPLRTPAKALVAVLIVLATGVVFYAEAPRLGGAGVSGSEDQSQQRPNIVLITMDTVRADHLSAYGYSRDTSPNLARLAAKGVLFENAVSASSWTLPSLSAIYTGLLPHQSGANAFRPLDPGWKTIESVLGQHGYATAGFNANYYYGESGWGLGGGFGAYDDDRTTLLYNLSRTLLGRTVIQPLYGNLDRYDVFYRRDAADLNADVFRWLRRPRSRPFYIYINYFDAHSSYLPPAPYNHRFGTLPRSVVRRWSAKGGFRPSEPLPAADRAALIDGYDNSLAYLDAQIGRLVHVLESSPDGKNTIFLITADHGEAFGEHGAYQHGNDLHREEIHVPLIVYGAGIPGGKRIAPPVAVRQLFATAIDLALGNEVPLHPYSLARFWEQDSPQEIARPVVSELSSSLSQAGVGEISLTTAQWHYIRNTRGQQYLYNWATDPAEKDNLISNPQDQATAENLNSRLREIEADSSEPWVGPEYLFALSGGGSSAQKPGAHAYPVGGAQAYFRSSVTPGFNGPGKSEKDLLKTLPYQ
ncbi:MAG TPA: sulfatase [Terriglobia bacterium]|nr:sulfatase [Terriglobia bacterium]